MISKRILFVHLIGLIERGTRIVDYGFFVIVKIG